MRSYRLKAFCSPLALEESATPVPTGDELLLRVVASGMCHSDLHIWEGGYDLGHGKRLLVTDRGVRLPLTMGHETVGVVVATGGNVDPGHNGRRCLIYPWIGCGDCHVCAEGDEQLCARPRSMGIYRDGGYADHVIVPHTRYLLDLDGLDPVASAPLACSGLTAFSALKKAGAITRTPIVIFGAGGLGLMSLRLYRALGGAGAVVIEIDERKRLAAEDAGAGATIDGRSLDVAAQITRATGGAHRVVIDFVGSEETAAIALHCLPKGGKIVLVGLFGGAAPWSLPLIPMRALTIQGSYVGSLAELRELLNLVRQEHVAPIPIACAPLDEANRMLTLLRNGQVVGRAVLTP